MDGLADTASNRRLHGQQRSLLHPSDPTELQVRHLSSSKFSLFNLLVVAFAFRLGGERFLSLPFLVLLVCHVWFRRHRWRPGALVRARGVFEFEEVLHLLIEVPD